MDIDTFLEIYLNPPSNFIGSAIFLLYIYAALNLTWLIVAGLVEKYRNARPTRTALSLRVFVACISFGALSYHMSEFLISSYVAWANRNKVPLPTRDNWKPNLWPWMFQSTLFTDFATELVRNKWATVWTEAALIWTGVVNVWMAVQGSELIPRNMNKRY